MLILRRRWPRGRHRGGAAPRWLATSWSPRPDHRSSLSAPGGVPRRCSSGPATSPSAGTWTTRRRPRSSDCRSRDGLPGRRQRLRRTAPPRTTRAATRRRWGRLMDRTMPAPGNHEYQTDGAAGYRATSGRPRSRTGRPGTRTTSVRGTSSSSTRTARRSGLRRRLAPGTLARRGPRRATATLHARDLAPPPVQLRRARQRPAVGPFWERLYAAGADVVINGHDHDYERFAPQSPDGATRTGAAASASSSSGPAAPRCAGFPRSAANSELRVARHPRRDPADAPPGKLRVGVVQPTTGRSPTPAAHRATDRDTPTCDLDEAAHGRPRAGGDHRRRRRRDLDRLSPRRARLDAISSSSTGPS